MPNSSSPIMKNTTLRCACIQTNTGPDPEHNLAQTLAMIREAAASGAALICLPEAVDILDADSERMQAAAVPLAIHPAIDKFRQAACSLKVAILAGSVAARDDKGQVVNRCVLIDSTGHIVCHYDKIHLFDAAPGAVVSTESKIYARGQQAVLAGMGKAQIGLSICYDLRFPYLFRTLAQAGANILSIPAAFMQVTGQAHWHALLRARAIENGCFVIAPAQCGIHYGTRQSYGHSIVIDPWGRVLAEAGTEPEIIYATIDFELVEAARQAIPSLAQDRSFTLTTH